MLYARRPKKDTWHFVPTCTQYPAADDTVYRKTKPTTGEFCNQCRAKHRAHIRERTHMVKSFGKRGFAAMYGAMARHTVHARRKR